MNIIMSFYKYNTLNALNASKFFDFYELHTINPFLKKPSYL